MNLKYIQYNLSEVQEEVDNILAQLKKGEFYTHAEFYSSMQHLIHHVNIAWNARQSTAGQIENLSEDILKQWSQFPTDITLI